jgi:hypothetical protein
MNKKVATTKMRMPSETRAELESCRSSGAVSLGIMARVAAALWQGSAKVPAETKGCAHAITKTISAFCFPLLAACPYTRRRQC